MSLQGSCSTKARLEDETCLVYHWRLGPDDRRDENPRWVFGCRDRNSRTHRLLRLADSARGESRLFGHAVLGQGDDYPAVQCPVLDGRLGLPSLPQGAKGPVEAPNRRRTDPSRNHRRLGLCINLRIRIGTSSVATTYRDMSSCMLHISATLAASVPSVVPTWYNMHQDADRWRA